jgi:hypothetical protein
MMIDGFFSQNGEGKTLSAQDKRVALSMEQLHKKSLRPMVWVKPSGT